MLGYAVRRIAGVIPTSSVIISASFFIVRLAPGGPFDQEQTLSREVRANLDSVYGLDQPITVQFGRYLRALSHGDFGPSYKQRDFTVTELIAQGLPVSATLGISAMLLAAGVGYTVWRAGGRPSTDFSRFRRYRVSSCWAWRCRHS